MGCFTSHECITNDNNNKKGASSKCCFTSHEYTTNDKGKKDVYEKSTSSKCCFTPCECATDSNKHKKGAFSKCYCLKRIPE